MVDKTSGPALAAANVKKVIVTGAASGIGASVARQLAATGNYRILAVDRDETGLKSLRESCNEWYGSRLLTCTVDLADTEAMGQRMSPIIDSLKCIDALVACHGSAADNKIGDREVWDRLLSVNLISNQRLLTLLDQRLSNHGRVVMVSSILGKVGKKDNTAYCTAKHGLLGLVKALALDMAPRGITVNAVLPSWVDTPMLRSELQPQASILGLSIEQLLRRVKKSIPLKRLLTGDDVASCIRFLLSPEASMITAQGIVIDGGFGCGMP